MDYSIWEIRTKITVIKDYVLKTDSLRKALTLANTVRRVKKVTCHEYCVSLQALTPLFPKERSKSNLPPYNPQPINEPEKSSGGSTTIQRSDSATAFLVERTPPIPRKGPFIVNPLPPTENALPPSPPENLLPPQASPIKDKDHKPSLESSKNTIPQRADRVSYGSSLVVAAQGLIPSSPPNSGKVPIGPLLIEPRRKTSTLDDVSR
jgi:hypothetical protein